MAKIKTKQIGEVASGLALESTAISYTQTNSTDYQIASVAAPALLVADTTLQNLAVFENAVEDVVVAIEPPVVVDPPPTIVDPPVIVGPPITGVVLIGTDGEEMLVGTDGNDIIDGKAGIDILMGGAGNDILSSSGSSWLYGDSGKDTFNLTGGWHVIADWNSAEDTLNVSFGSRVSVVTHLSSNDFTLTTAQNISVENANNAGTIFLSGYYSNDRLTGSAGVDILYGDSGDDVLIGNAGNDNLDGGQGNDTLLGGAGDDYLNGGNGNDTLTGGAGSDTFSIKASDFADNLNGIDKIVDFVSGVDKIELRTEYYQPVLKGGISLNWNIKPNADELVQGAGAVAQDANDRFIFDTDTGALYFDSDGNGANEAVQFAILQGVTQLSVDDFLAGDNLFFGPVPVCSYPPATYVGAPNSALVDQAPPPSFQEYYDDTVAANPGVEIVGIEGFNWPWVQFGYKNKKAMLYSMAFFINKPLNLQRRHIIHDHCK